MDARIHGFNLPSALFSSSNTASTVLPEFLNFLECVSDDQLNDQVNLILTNTNQLDLFRDNVAMKQAMSLKFIYYLISKKLESCKLLSLSLLPILLWTFFSEGPLPLQDTSGIQACLLHFMDLPRDEALATLNIEDVEKKPSYFHQKAPKPNDPTNYTPVLRFGATTLHQLDEAVRPSAISARNQTDVVEACLKQLEHCVTALPRWTHFQLCYFYLACLGLEVTVVPPLRKCGHNRVAWTALYQSLLHEASFVQTLSPTGRRIAVSETLLLTCAQVLGLCLKWHEDTATVSRLALATLHMRAQLENLPLPLYYTSALVNLMDKNELN
eukprot:Platyproteum_vivax@DN3867_c0_g1_i1.p1